MAEFQFTTEISSKKVLTYRWGRAILDVGESGTTSRLAGF